MQQRQIAIQTDFGTADGRAAKLIGTIKRIDESLDVSFFESKCPRGDVMVAGTHLYNSLTFFPAGTVYVSIVERTTGSNRPCAALTQTDQIILTPDNGILTLWIQNHGLKALRHFDDARMQADMNPYATLAARLANGSMRFDELGTPCAVEEAQRYSVRASTLRDGFAQCGVLSVMENFGNLNLTVSIEEFERTGIRFGDAVRVRLERDGEPCFDNTIPYDRSFGFAPIGTPILFNGSTGYIGLGMNQASFSGTYMKDRHNHANGIANYDVFINK